MSRALDISKLMLRADSTLSDAIAAIDVSGKISLALVVDGQDRLINTITDGDVRRGLLAGARLTDPISVLLEIKSRTPHPVPVTAPEQSDRLTLLKTMQERGVRQIPLTDNHGKVVDIVILADMLPQPVQPLQAVVMAGGEGLRLRPLTNQTPKPMLQVGGRPIIEHIISQLRETGVSQINIATRYHSQQIMDHFGDGGDFGVSISYVQEDSPLGTVGALGLLKRPQEPLLVVNGDILTNIDFGRMLIFHQEHQAEVTVGVKRYEMKVPYGVVECEGSRLKAVREKPELSFFVNAGIYVLEPSAIEHIETNQHLDMTDLITKLLGVGKTVVSFPICEYWLDIGQHEHYQQALKDIESGKLKTAPSRPCE